MINNLLKSLVYAVFSVILVLSIPLVGGWGEGIFNPQGITLLKRITILCAPPFFVGYLTLYLLLIKFNKIPAFIFSLLVGIITWLIIVIIGSNIIGPVGWAGIAYVVSSIASLVIGFFVSLLITIKNRRVLQNE